jgi:hypothetical protein
MISSWVPDVIVGAWRNGTSTASASVRERSRSGRRKRRSASSRPRGRRARRPTRIRDATADTGEDAEEAGEEQETG